MVMYFITITSFRHFNKPLTNLALKENFISYWPLKWLYTFLWNSQSMLFFLTEESILKFQPKLNWAELSRERSLFSCLLSLIFTHAGFIQERTRIHLCSIACECLVLLCCVTDYQKGFLEHVLQTCPFLSLFLCMCIYKCCIYLYEVPQRNQVIHSGAAPIWEGDTELASSSDFFLTKCSFQIPITTVLLKGRFLPLLTKCSISIYLASVVCWIM